MNLQMLINIMYKLLMTLFDIQCYIKYIHFTYMHMYIGVINNSVFLPDITYVNYLPTYINRSLPPFEHNAENICTYVHTCFSRLSSRQAIMRHALNIHYFIYIKYTLNIH
jgi:hypothetical protein